MDRLLERDPAVRILSVVLAVLLWFLGMNQQNPIVQRSFTVQLVQTPVSPGLVLMDLLPQSVTVVVQGRQSIIESMTEADLTATVDLSPATGGRNRLPVEIGLRNRAVRVVDYSPQQAEATVDMIEKRMVNVEIRLAGNPDPDYVAERMRLSAATVEVIGPQSIVQSVSRVTGVVDIEGVTSSVVRMARLRPEDFAGREVRDVVVDPAEIEVTVPLRALPPSKTVPVRPLLTGVPELGFRVMEVIASPQVITIRAPASVIANIESLSTTPVNVHGRADSFSDRVDVVVPSGVVWQSQSQVDVTVTIGEDVVGQRFNEIPIRLQNLAVGFQWELEPTQVDVRLEGRKDLINKLTAGMITAYVDARDEEGHPLGAGQHRLIVKFDIPEGVRIIGAIPYQVQLTLTPRR